MFLINLYTNVIVCTLLLPIYAFNYGILVIANCNWRLLAIGLNTRRNVAHVQRMTARHGELLHEPHTTTARFQLTEQRRFNTGKRLRKRAASKETWDGERNTQVELSLQVCDECKWVLLSQLQHTACSACVCVCNTFMSSRCLSRHSHGKYNSLSQSQALSLAVGCVCLFNACTSLSLLACDTVQVMCNSRMRYLGNALTLSHILTLS